MLFVTQLCTLASSMWISTSTVRRPLPITVALALLVTMAACTRTPSIESDASAQPSRTAVGERHDLSQHDLSQDEAAGGHTLRKHVGRSDAELRQRLEHERNISAASTWTDRQSAESAVGAAIAQQSNRISRWLERASHPNLVLDYDGDSAHPFGRTLRRGEDHVQPCARAVIVLKWDGGNSYHVLTAYPECRS
jgi:hypothetical protein